MHCDALLSTLAGSLGARDESDKGFPSEGNSHI